VLRVIILDTLNYKCERRERKKVAMKKQTKRKKKIILKWRGITIYNNKIRTQWENNNSNNNNNITININGTRKIHNKEMCRRNVRSISNNVPMWDKK